MRIIDHFKYGSSIRHECIGMPRPRTFFYIVEATSTDLQKPLNASARCRSYCQSAFGLVRTCAKMMMAMARTRFCGTATKRKHDDDASSADAFAIDIISIMIIIIGLPAITEHPPHTATLLV